MLAQNTQASFPALTCSICGGKSPFKLPGVTTRTRYTCPQCCDRILLERGDQEIDPDISLLDEDSEIRQVERQHGRSGGPHAHAEDIS